MGQVVEAALITVSGTAIVGVAGFGAAIYSGRRSLANVRAQRVWDERARVYIDAIAPVHYRQNNRDYEMRAAILDEKTRQHAEAYLARYTEPDAFELKESQPAASSRR